MDHHLIQINGLDTHPESFQQYKSTNKFNLFRFIPVFLLASLVTLLMSFVLLVADMFYYLFIIMPVIIGLPVLGMIYLVIRAGRCRNKILGVIVGIFLILQFYIGFWALGYMSFVGLSGYEEGTQFLISETGSSGIWGFIKYHCKSNNIEDATMPGSENEQPDSFDKYSSYGFYGIELLLLLFLAFKISSNLPRRVFYESSKKWAQSKSIRFFTYDFSKLMQIVKTQSFSELEEMSKFGKYGNQQKTYAELIIEYCKDVIESPVYISIKGVGLDKIAKEIGVNGNGLIEKTYLRQIEMPYETIFDLHKALPELKLLPQDASHLKSMKTLSDTEFPEFGAAYPVHPLETYTKSDRSHQEDFRIRAIEESDKLVTDPTPNTLKQLNVSLCIPIKEEEAVSVKKIAHFPTILSILTILCIFGGLGTALWGSELTIPDTEKISVTGYILITLGICIFLSSFFLLFFSKPLYIRRMKKFLLDRPGSLFDADGFSKILASNIENSKTYHVFKLTPDDVGLICLDSEKQRLLIEGCTHRYVICGQDVIQIEPLQDMNRHVINISYQIGNIQLSLTLISESVKKAFLNQTIFGLLKGRSSQKLVDELKEVLGIASTQLS